MLSELVKRNKELEEEIRRLKAARAALRQDLERTQAEYTRLEAESATLQEERKELEGTCANLQGECNTLQADRKNLQAERNWLRQKIEQLQRMLFGRRSEKVTPEALGFVQLELFEEASREIEAEMREETEEVPETPRKKRRGRKPIPKDIPREEIVLDVDPELQTCPNGHGKLRKIGEDRTEILDFVPAIFRLLVFVRPKYACSTPNCDCGVLTEPLPPQPILKGRPSAGLLSHVVVSKHQDHLPLYRQERIFSRFGLGISRSTLCDWIQAVAILLAPIVAAMKRQLLLAALLQADETPVNVRDPSVSPRMRRAYIWTYGIPWGEVVYDFTLSRSGQGPEEFLRGFQGHYLQTDAYAGYNAACRAHGITSVGCWSHARRRFFAAKSEEPEFASLAVACIQKLYRIERRAKKEGIVGEALVELRRSEALPILKKLRELLSARALSVLPRSLLGEAIGYTLAQWDALVRYVDIPQADIDNNAAENSVRGVVLGRKNWLAIGHPDAGPRAAVILSLVETCRRLKVDPFAYLRWAIEQMSRDPSQAEELTPRRWLERCRAQAAEKAHETWAE